MSGDIAEMETIELALDYRDRLEARREALSAEIAALPSGPVTLEIGCGHGHYLTAYARDRSEVCVGIDICRDRIARALRKRDRAKLSHLFFFRCDAADFLEILPEANRISRVIILFPDPWPKRRHHKNRLISADFLSRLAERTSPDCDLYFRTDHHPYFEAALETVSNHRDWQPDPNLLWPFEMPTVFQKRAESYSSLAAVRIG